METEFLQQADALKERLIEKLWTLLKDKSTIGIRDYFGVELVPQGTRFSQKMLAELDYLNIGTDKWTGDARLDTLIEQTINNYTIKYKELDAVLKREKYNLTNGDELPTGIIQLAKVYIAKKRKLRVGDKMAGRRG